MTSVSALAYTGFHENEPCRVGITKPELNDPIWVTLVDRRIMKSVAISATLLNNCDHDIPFTAITEVRNEEGVTVFLQSQTGILIDSGYSEVNIPWQPTEPCMCELRAFAISNFTSPQILTQVSSGLGGLLRTTMLVLDVWQPGLTDTEDRPIDSASVGQPVVIFTGVSSQNPRSLRLAVIVEVRDESDVSVYLQSEAVMLPSKSSSSLRLSWLPVDAGTYELRVLAISNFTTPEILGHMQSNQVEVFGD
jgi:hypothetical protein